MTVADEAPAEVLARIKDRTMAEVHRIGHARVGSESHPNSYVAPGQVVEICYCVGHDHAECSPACHHREAVPA